MNPALPNNKNWYYVYLLSSSRISWIYPALARKSWVYIGCTHNLEKRLKEHMQGKVYTTRKMLPVELMYYEAYMSKDCAFQREKSLKAYGSSLGKLKSRLGIKRKGRAG